MQDKSTLEKESETPERMDHILASLAEIRRTINEYGISDTELLSDENEGQILLSREREEAIRAFKRSRTEPEPVVEEAFRESSRILENARAKAEGMVNDAEQKVSVLLKQAERLKEEAEEIITRAEEDSRSIRALAEDQAARTREEGSRTAREAQRKILAENNQMRLDIQKEAEDIRNRAVEEASEILYQAEQEAKRLKEEEEMNSVSGMRERAEAEIQELRQAAEEEAKQIREEAEKAAKKRLDEAEESKRSMVEEAQNLLERTREQADDLLKQAQEQAVPIKEETAQPETEVQEIQEIPEEAPAENAVRTNAGFRQELCLFVFLAVMLIGCGLCIHSSEALRQAGMLLCLLAVIPVLFAAYRFSKAAWITAGILSAVYAICRGMGIVQGTAEFHWFDVFFCLLPLVSAGGMIGFTASLKQVEEENRQMKKDLDAIDIHDGMFGAKRLEQDLEQFRTDENVRMYRVQCTNQAALEEKLKASGMKRFEKQWYKLLEEQLGMHGRVYRLSKDTMGVLAEKDAVNDALLHSASEDTEAFEEAAAHGLQPQFVIQEEE